VTQSRSKIVSEIEAANTRYAAEFGDKGELAMPPARRFAILTCMDARLDPAKYAGLSEGDAHVIRNAGGRATDDGDPLAGHLAHALGTIEWLSSTTECGLELFTDEIMGELLEDNLETADFDGKTWSNPKHGGGNPDGRFIKWHTIKDQATSVTEDVKRIREHPLVPQHIPISGYIYDVKSGRLIEVPEATAAGAIR